MGWVGLICPQRLGVCLLTTFDGGLFSFSHRTFASDSILMKPLNFIVLSLLNKNIFHNCAEEMKNCRDWERGGTPCLPHSRSAADSVLNVLGSAANKPTKRPCVHGNTTGT